MLGWLSLPPDTRLAMRLLKYARIVITTSSYKTSYEAT